MRAGAACVHDALGNALVIEMGDLFAEDEVLQQARAAAQRVLVVRDRNALVGRQSLVQIAGGLMGSPLLAGPLAMFFGPAVFDFCLAMGRELRLYCRAAAPTGTRQYTMT